MRLGQITFVQGAETVQLLRPDSLAASFDLKLPTALPGSTRALTVDTAGQMGFADLNGGTVTSVGLALPTSVFTISGSPVTESGSLTGTFKTQAQNAIFAGPASGGSGVPDFRALVYGDLSALVGTTSNTLAAGNDSRFHTQNTDTGTTQTSFQVDSGNSGPRIKNAGGALEVRNAGDTDYADLVVENLTIKGTQTIVDSTTVALGDNIIVLNKDEAGTPSQNAGIEVERGTSTNATLLWDESNDRFVAGETGSEKAIARRHAVSFVNADLVGGALTVTHGLGNKFVSVVIVDDNDRQVMPDEITFSSATALSVDLSSFGTITGTWNAVVVG